MTAFPLISLKDALESLGRHPGILIGPGATCMPGSIPQIVTNALKLATDVPELGARASEENYPALLDTLRAKAPVQAELVAREIREGLRVLRPTLDLPHLVKAGWSACISLSQDVLFES